MRIAHLLFLYAIGFKCALVEAQRKRGEPIEPTPFLI